MFKVMYLFFKAEQYGLFEGPVSVRAHVRKKTGTFVAPYQATRKHRLEAQPEGEDLVAMMQKPPVEKPAPTPEKKEPGPTDKTWLDVPYDDRRIAKNAGARWNQDKKRWYVIGPVPYKLESYVDHKYTAEQVDIEKPTIQAVSTSESSPAAGKGDVTYQATEKQKELINKLLPGAKAAVQSKAENAKTSLRKKIAEQQILGLSLIEKGIQGDLTRDEAKSFLATYNIDLPGYVLMEGGKNAYLVATNIIDHLKWLGGA